jgi:hypothetical protein
MEDRTSWARILPLVITKRAPVPVATDEPASQERRFRYISSIRSKCHDKTGKVSEPKFVAKLWISAVFGGSALPARSPARFSVPMGSSSRIPLTSDSTKRHTHRRDS